MSEARLSPHRRFRNRRHSRAEKPLRAELLSIERLEERARALAASFTLARKGPSGDRRFFRRLDDNARVLRESYRILAYAVHREEFVAPAAEWLLDNFHLIESEIRGVRHDLPRQYYRELPKLAPRDMTGTARMYAMALELISHTDGRLDRLQLIRFMTAYQSVAPLTIGELWAWPSMLKLALLENLRRLADETLQSREARLLAERHLTSTRRQNPPAVSTPAARRARLGLRGPPAAANAGVRCGCRHGSRQRSRTCSPHKAPRPKRRFAPSTRTRPPRRCRWPMRSPACGSAPLSTGRSISRP